MNGNVVMKAKDTVFAALAECFVTIGTRRYILQGQEKQKSRLQTVQEKPTRGT